MQQSSSYGPVSASLLAVFTQMPFPIRTFVIMLLLDFFTWIYALPFRADLFWLTHEQAHPQMSGIGFSLLPGFIAKVISDWSVMSAAGKISFTDAHVYLTYLCRVFDSFTARIFG